MSRDYDSFRGRLTVLMDPSLSRLAEETAQRGRKVRMRVTIDYVGEGSAVRSAAKLMEHQHIKPDHPAANVEISKQPLILVEFLDAPDDAACS